MPGASTDSTCSSFASPTFSNSRAPPPSRIGTTETTSSSSRPAERYCCATDAQPARDTSFSPAAARACSSADSIPSVTKWNVVPPCISSGSRGWLVRTKTGWWKGGLSPHQPFHDSSHGPGPPPNMFRPMMVAPAPPRMSSANGVLALTSPPSSPWLSRNASSGTSQPWSSSPPTPSGCSGDWCGPATKPSIDIVMFSFSFLIDPPSVDMLVGSPSASEVIGQARSLTKLATTRSTQSSAAPVARSAALRCPHDIEGDSMTDYMVKPLDADTWDAYARLVERHNGVFGGCWCTWFHTFHGEKTFTAEGNRALKERLVHEVAHTLRWFSTATRQSRGASTAIRRNCRTSTIARST